MSEAMAPALGVFAATAVVVVAILFGARLWRSKERWILVAGCVGTSLLFIMASIGLTGFGTGVARLTVRNESPWPMGVLTGNAGDQDIPPSDEANFVEYGGPGWIAGYIGRIEILGGPNLSTLLVIRSLNSDQHATITITEITSSRPEWADVDVGAD